MDVLFEVRAREAGCDDLTDVLVSKGMRLRLPPYRTPSGSGAKGQSVLYFFDMKDSCGCLLFRTALNTDALYIGDLLALGSRILIQKTSNWT